MVRGIVRCGYPPRPARHRWARRQERTANTQTAQRRIDPHRRRVRLPWLAHPASPQERSPGRETLRLHLLVEEVLASIIDKVRRLTRRALHRILADLLRRLNPAIRGWCDYFCHGVSKQTFSYLDHYAFWRIVSWLRNDAPVSGCAPSIRRFLAGWRIRQPTLDATGLSHSGTAALASLRAAHPRRQRLAASLAIQRCSWALRHPAWLPSERGSRLLRGYSRQRLSGRCGLV